MEKRYWVWFSSQVILTVKQANLAAVGVCASNWQNFASRPDLLLLDEPTNHLDIESIVWLENFLSSTSSALVLVSHDKAFIDAVTTRTIEIIGKIYDCKVNYSNYLNCARTSRTAIVRHENQQKMIADTEEFIERFRYKATKAVQVQSRIKQLKN